MTAFCHKLLKKLFHLIRYEKQSIRYCGSVRLFFIRIYTEQIVDHRRHLFAGYDAACAIWRIARVGDVEQRRTLVQTDGERAADARRCRDGRGSAAV